MPQVWKNVEEVHKSGSAILELASSLSQLFEKLYLKQVCLHSCAGFFASASCTLVALVISFVFSIMKEFFNYYSTSSFSSVHALLVISLFNSCVPLQKS